MNYEFTSEQTKLRDRAAVFCDRELAPLSKKLDVSSSAEKQSIIKDSLLKLGQSGLLSAGHLPDGLDMIDVYLTAEETARACPATFMSARASSFMCGGTISLFGNTDQINHYLPGILSGDMIGAVAWTEDHAGSDLEAITSRAEYIDGEWRIDARKGTVINAPLADILLVLAKVDDDSMSLFLVEKDTPGLETGPVLETMGLRGAAISPVTLTHCVPAGILGGIPGKGLEQVRHIMSLGAIGIAALAVGIGNSCMKLSTAHAGKRKAFGRKIGAFQDVGFRLADMYVANDLSRMLALRAAWAFNRRDVDAHVLASCARLFAGESVTRIANWGMQILAGHGYMAGSDMERLYRDAKFCEICEGTSELQREYIARNELDRFS